MWVLYRLIKLSHAIDFAKMSDELFGLDVSQFESQYHMNTVYIKNALIFILFIATQCPTWLNEFSHIDSVIENIIRGQSAIVTI